MYAKIADIKYFRPKLFNLEKIIKKKNFQKIFERTGIKKISRTGKKKSALYLAQEAAKLVIKNHKVDGIIYVSQSPEYFLPSGACILQDRLGLPKNIFAFDVNQGCSGYIYGLCLANSLIRNSVAKNILLICSDTYSKYISKTYNSCLPIFSDAASATIVKKTNKKFFLDFKFGTDGSGYKDLIVENSGFHANNLKPEIYMHGKKIFMFTMSNIPQLVIDILKKNNLSLDKIDYFIFHQASKLVIEQLVKKLRLNSKKVFCNLENFGNTVSSSIPIALTELKKKKNKKKF